MEWKNIDNKPSIDRLILVAIPFDDYDEEEPEWAKYDYMTAIRILVIESYIDNDIHWYIPSLGREISNKELKAKYWTYIDVPK